MVNLLEPFLSTLLKNTLKPLPSKATEENPTLAPSSLHIPKSKNQLIPLPLDNEKSQPKFPEAKRAFFSDIKSSHWFEIQKDEGIESKEIKHQWNFLFPEIPWSEERIYWEERNRKSKFYSTLASKKDSFLLCVLFDSERTGKVWIYMEYNPKAEDTSSIFFQTERDSMKRKIEREIAQLEKQLYQLGNIRIQVETSNDNFAQMTQIRLGILA